MRIEVTEMAATGRGIAARQGSLAWRLEMERAQAELWFQSPRGDAHGQDGARPNTSSPAPKEGPPTPSQPAPDRLRAELHLSASNAARADSANGHHTAALPSVEPVGVAVQEAARGPNRPAPLHLVPQGALADTPGGKTLSAWPVASAVELDPSIFGASAPSSLANDPIPGSAERLHSGGPGSTPPDDFGSEPARTTAGALQWVQRIWARSSTLSAPAPLACHWHGERLVLDFQGLSGVDALSLPALLPALEGALRSHGIRDLVVRVDGRTVLDTEHSQTSNHVPNGATLPEAIGQILNHI